MTFLKLVSLSYFSGLLIAVSAFVLYQDWYGLEGYIARCREGWISASITVPIAIALLAAGVLIVGFARAIAKSLDKQASLLEVKKEGSNE